MKRLTAPKLPTISKKAVLITAGVIVVVAITAFGIVKQEQANKAAATQAAADHAVQVKRDQATQATIQSLETQVAQLTAAHKASCDYLGGLTLAKATKSLVIVPTASQCPNPKQ